MDLVDFTKQISSGKDLGLELNIPRNELSFRNNNLNMAVINFVYF